MKRLLKCLSSKNWVYKLALRIIATKIVNSQNLLRPEYLMSKGWVEEEGFYFEPEVKDRDRVWIQFEGHYFRVWHGKDKTFISLESKTEWFETYYLIIHSDNGRCNLADI